MSDRSAAVLVNTDADRRTTPISRVWGILRAVRASRYTPMLVLWILAIFYFGLTEPSFLRQANISGMLVQNAALFTVSIAMTVILLTGAVDLSVGGMVALVSLLVPLSNRGVPPILALLITITAGVLLSAVVNGLPIGLVGMNPFVVTLGTAAVFTGIANVITTGNTWLIDDPDLVNTLANHEVGPIPIPVLVMAAVLGVFAWVLRFTYFGRNVYAVGGNPEAARLAGISIARVRIVAFALLGGAAGVAAIIQAGQLSSVAPTVGLGLELHAVAAVLLGGTSLAGGKGTVFGTALAVLFLGTVENGLDIVGVSSFWQGVVTGSVVVLAVGFDQVRERMLPSRPTKGNP